MDNELYHYGVKGMKWGVRKEVYKSMNRQQKKATRKKYYQTPEGRIKRATTIGTILGGPLGGVIAGSILNKKVGQISPKSVSKGKKVVEKVKSGKLETDEQKIKKLMDEGKINPRSRHIFDQNGNLFMVYWDD